MFNSYATNYQRVSTGAGPGFGEDEFLEHHIWGYPVFRKPLNSYVKIENCDKPLGPRGESSWFILAGLVPLGFYSMVYTMVNGIFIGFIGSPEIFCTEKKGPA